DIVHALDEIAAREGLARPGMESALPCQPLPAFNASVCKNWVHSITRARRFTRSAAIRVVPAPPNGSRIKSLRFEQSRMASATIATGLTVGWRDSLHFFVPLNAFWLT